MKEKFWQYILDNFTIDNDGRKMICNILDWIWLQSMDKEDTVNALLLLLDGIGIISIYLFIKSFILKI